MPVEISNAQKFEVLREALAKVVSIPPLEWLALIRLLGMRKLNKGDLYFEAGQNFNELGFVVTGLFYNYVIDIDGKESVKAFIRESSPVGPYSSMLQKQPARLSSRVLEKSVLITLKFTDLQTLYKRHVCWVNMGRLYAEELCIRKEERESQFQTMTAKQRYDVFVQANKKFVDRIPQYLIASYIGVSEVHLSRIRSANKSSKS